MAQSEAWKQLERDAAQAFGGQRNPASAGAGGADVQAPGLVVECKHLATSVHGTTYRAERAKRRQELAAGSLFVLVTRDRGREALATVTLHELADLVRDANLQRDRQRESLAAAAAWARNKLAEAALRRASGIEAPADNADPDIRRALAAAAQRQLEKRAAESAAGNGESGDEHA